MASVPTIDEQDATTTTPLPKTMRGRRFAALYVVLGLVAVVAGVLIGVHRHDAAAIGSIAAPTEQSVVATAPPGLPTPTPLATKSLPTSAPPTESPPTAVPPTVVPPTGAPPAALPPSAPVVAAPARATPVVVQNDQHGNGNGNGKGKDKGKGKGD